MAVFKGPILLTGGRGKRGRGIQRGGKGWRREGKGGEEK